MSVSGRLRSPNGSRRSPTAPLAYSDGGFYTDEIRCPTLVTELAAALLELVQLDASGPLHVAAPEALSRYELARLLRAARGLDPEAIRGVPSPRAGRARNVALDSSRAEKVLPGPLRGASAALRA